MADITQAGQRRKLYWLMGIGAGLALTFVAAAIVGWLILGGRVPAPDLKSKAVDEAPRIITDTKPKFADEQTQVNGAPQGSVVGQHPAAGSRVKPCSTVKIPIAGASKPLSALDLSGYWDSSNDFRYDVIQEGKDFFWEITQWPRPDPPEEHGSGSLSDTGIAAQWSGGNGDGSAQGQVVYQDEKGLAQVITWDDGAIWFRTESDGAGLAHHYGLEKYDRAKLLEAIRQTSLAESDC